MRTNERIVVAVLSLSAVAFGGLITREHYSDTAIIPVKGDVPTLGFGMTHRPDGTKVQPGDRTNPVESVQRSLAHIQKSENEIKQCITAPLFQAEYDILVDFSYQYGTTALCNSDMVRFINQGSYTKACHAYAQFRFMTSNQPYQGWEPYRWNSAGTPIRWRFDCSTPNNKVCRGVWLRQQDRITRCLKAQP